MCRVKVQGLGARPSSCRPSEAPTLPANALSRSACTVVAAAEDVGVSRRSALFGAGLASGALLLSLPESSKAESEDSSTSDLGAAAYFLRKGDCDCVKLLCSAQDL